MAQDNVAVTVRFLFRNAKYGFLFRHGKNYVFKMPASWLSFGMVNKLAVGDVVEVKDVFGKRHPVIITDLTLATPEDLADRQRIYKPKRKLKFTTHADIQAPVLDTDSSVG